MAGFRQRENGKWEARVHRRGTDSTKSKSFSTRVEAEKWARQYESQVDRGEVVASSGVTTVATAIDLYYDAHSDMADRLKYNLATVRFDLGKYYISKLTKGVLKDYVKRLKVTPVPPPKNKHPDTVSKTKPRCYAGSTIRYVYYALKKALEWHAEEFNYRLPSNLFEGANLPDCWENPRSRLLQPGELDSLLSVAAASSKRSFSWPLLIKFAIATAMRDQEMIFARWKQITADGKSLIIPKAHSKTKKDRVAPLSSDARAILEQLRIKFAPVNPDDLIFSEFEGKPRAVSSLFKTITKKANVIDFHFHDFRHVSLTKYAESGKITVFQLLQISGHSQIKTLQRYVNLIPGTVADHMDKVVFD